MADPKAVSDSNGEWIELHSTADVDLNVKGGDQASALGASLYHSSRMWITGLLVAATLIGSAIAAVIARMITRPVGQTVDILVDNANVGNWMLHCHIAEHLEAGMMANYTITP